MLLLEESEASKLTADKLSELLALRNTFIEEARQRQEEKLDELELLIEQYHAQRMKLEESVADTQSMSSIGDLTDASGAAELTHCAPHFFSINSMILLLIYFSLSVFAIDAKRGAISC